MSDPTGGWAEATAKTSEATTEAIKAGSAALSFIADPLRGIVGMATDKLKIVRCERLIRLSAQLQLFLRERGLDAPSRALPPNFAIPLIEHASLEDDDDLQDIWARMLVNAGDATSGTERRTAFISMLKDMTTFDVMILAKIAKISPSKADGVVFTLNFRDSDDQTDSGKRPTVPAEGVSVSLGNLARLGCISVGSDWMSKLAYSQVTLTELGSAFITACTSR